MSDECRNWNGAGSCYALKELVCGGFPTNNGKCPFYKTEAQWQEEQKKVRKRLRMIERGEIKK